MDDDRDETTADEDEGEAIESERSIDRDSIRDSFTPVRSDETRRNETDETDDGGDDSTARGDDGDDGERGAIRRRERRERERKE